MTYEKLGYLLGKQAAKRIDFETKVDLHPFGSPESDFEVRLPPESRATTPEELKKVLKFETEMELEPYEKRLAEERLMKRLYPWRRVPLERLNKPLVEFSLPKLRF
jgi:hypothetical protein